MPPIMPLTLSRFSPLFQLHSLSFPFSYEHSLIPPSLLSSFTPPSLMLYRPHPLAFPSFQPFIPYLHSESVPPSLALFTTVSILGSVLPSLALPSPFTRFLFPPLPYFFFLLSPMCHSPILLYLFFLFLFWFNFRPSFTPLNLWIYFILS